MPAATLNMKYVYHAMGSYFYATWLVSVYIIGECVEVCERVCVCGLCSFMEMNRLRKLQQRIDHP